MMWLKKNVFYMCTYMCLVPAQRLTKCFMTSYRELNLLIKLV